MKSTFLAALLMALLPPLLGGCVASKNPVGPVAEAVSEQRLAGSWQYVGEQGREWDFLHVFVEDDAKTLEVVAINSGERAWAVLSGHITAVGERRFVNLRIESAGSSLREDLARQGRADSYPYSFIAYRLEDDGRLSLAAPLAQLHDAVKNGRLAGETAGDYDAFISDSSAKIAEVLGAIPEADLFDDAAVYKRIAAAATP